MHKDLDKQIDKLEFTAFQDKAKFFESLSGYLHEQEEKKLLGLFDKEGVNSQKPA